MIMLQYIFLHVHVNGNQYLWQIAISMVIFWFIISNQGQGSSIPDYGASGTRDSHPGVKIKKEGYSM